MKTIGKGFLLGIGIILADILINKIIPFIVNLFFITDGKINENIMLIPIGALILCIFALVIALEIKRSRKIK